MGEHPEHSEHSAHLGWQPHKDRRCCWRYKTKRTTRSDYDAPQQASHKPRWTTPAAPHNFADEDYHPGPLLTGTDKPCTAPEEEATQKSGSGPAAAR